MSRPCKKFHANPLNHYRKNSGDYCHICWRFCTSPEFQKLWATEDDPAPVIPLPAVPPRLRTTRISPEKLIRGQSNAAFNGGMIRYKNRLLLAYRTSWADALCHIAEIADDGNYTPTNNVTLHALRGHPKATFGREDPRLFIFRNRLHISFTSLADGGGPTHILYARLSDDLQVEEIFDPEFIFTNGAWEKNWALFEWQGELMAVYKPGRDVHRVIHIRETASYPFAEVPWTLPWSGGDHMAGGAPPVLVGDKFYHWFHGRFGGWDNGIYTQGVYTFEARPPFRPIACTPDPILQGDPAWKLPHQRGTEPAVVFPAGAFVENGRWIVSRGTQDMWVDVDEWSQAEVDAYLDGQIFVTPTPVRDVVQVAEPLPTVRGNCLHLGKRTEFREGCSGWGCRHDCEAGEPAAVPGGNCQACPKWEAEGAEW